MDKATKQAEKERLGLTKSEWAYRGRIIQLRIDTLFSTVKRECVTHPGAVAVLPIDHKGDLILIKQWRHAVQKIFIEVPAGVLEPGEDPNDCAQRELQEEIGFKAKTMLPIGGIYTSAGFCDEYIHLYLAENLEKSELPPDEHEAIDLYPLSLDDAFKQIEDNTISDAKTIVAILRYKKWKEEKKI